MPKLFIVGGEPYRTGEEARIAALTPAVLYGNEAMYIHEYIHEYDQKTSGHIQTTLPEVTPEDIELCGGKRSISVEALGRVFTLTIGQEVLCLPQGDGTRETRKITWLNPRWDGRVVGPDEKYSTIAHAGPWYINTMELMTDDITQCRTRLL